MDERYASVHPQDLGLVMSCSECRAPTCPCRWCHQAPHLKACTGIYEDREEAKRLAARRVKAQEIRHAVGQIPASALDPTSWLAVVRTLATLDDK